MTAEPQTTPKTKKSIWKRWWMIVIYVIVGIAIIANLSGGSDEESTAEEPTSEASASGDSVEDSEVSESEETTTEPEPTPEETQETEPEPTPEETQEEVEDDTVPSEYRSALRSAETYADMMHMSKAGIYDQLTSDYGDQFTAEAAQYAIDNMEADWNNNALESAKTYQDMMDMSPAAIHDQLISDYGDKFTPEQADYAIENLP